ncbi:hypothetical protein [Kutzneria sp. NPDC052558]|uniref:hypothetical protein n=1 Tax=Kutzneria sp. NPDC052558 TaxID=3364121 RepID=UPI0037CB7FAC
MKAVRVVLVAASVIAATLAVGGPAQASARSCHVLVCNEINGTGLQVEWVEAGLTWNSRFYGHFQISGGGLNANSPTQSWGSPDHWRLTVGHNLPDQALVCVAGWEHIDGGYRQRGNACNKIHA